jgi:cyclopropane fatty-acyl-phospholipid synthase-like methyltransferase
MDKSNGYEEIAPWFIHTRGMEINGIGVSVVRDWACTLGKGSSVLDLGCGTGIPITNVLLDQGMLVHGIDASPTLVKVFQQNFPNTIVTCEAVEDSSFFDKKFDGIIAVGLLFLLSEETQVMLLKKAANSLAQNGKLLFTSPVIETRWNDVMTGQQSISLGSEKYEEILSESGVVLLSGFEDEGNNYYFNAVKV